MATHFQHYGERTGGRLFVLLHGMDRDDADLAQLKNVILENFAGDHVLTVSYPASRWSNARPLAITAKCVDEIDAEFTRRGGEGYTEVILIGHSLGALIARKICLIAHGICADYAAEFLFPPTAKGWANKITRLVLLAGMSRGWKLSPRNPYTPRLRWLGRCFQYAVAHIFGRGRLVRAAHQGTPFIVNLRLDWLALANGSHAGQTPPELVVQVAGLKDTMVHPSDHIDLEAGKNFKYLSVEETKHNEMVDFTNPIQGPKRKEKFLYALRTDAQNFQGEIVPGLPKVDPKVTEAVLLLHGIRDYGKWQEDLRDHLEAGAHKRGVSAATSISNYDYLPLLPFLFGYGRTLHIERFMDRYAEVRSRYPNAACSFAGHSNGTYLMVSALRRYEAASFARVALLGSIVQRNFPWIAQFQSRVKEVRNYVASSDAVVAIFPSVFEMIRLVPLLHRFPPNRDFGSAGHTGFTQVDNAVRNVGYVEGGHGSALGEPCRESLLSFLLGDPVAKRPAPPLLKEQNCWVVFAHSACVLLWAAMLAALVLGMWIAIAANAHFGWRYPWLPAAVGLIYIFLFFRF